MKPFVAPQPTFYFGMLMSCVVVTNDMDILILRRRFVD